MQFEHIEYLIGLIAIPGLLFLFFLVLKWKKKTAAKMGDASLVQQLVKNYSPAQFALKFGIALLALTAIVIGAANLRKKGLTENINRTGVDVMLVLDVSKSMMAEDIRPSRLIKAKQLLTKLLDKLENDRVGLVLFAGRAYVQMPLTIDQSAAKMYIQDANPDVVPAQGTVIADALRMANSSFNSKEHKYKAIVLLSDGEDHDPDAKKAARQLADDGVMINTVGIGSPDGATIIDPVTRESKRDEHGELVVSRLNEAELMELATLTNGAYIRLDNVDDAVSTLTQRLGGIEQKALTDSEFISYRNFFPWFLGAALLLLLSEIFIPERKLSAV